MKNQLAEQAKITITNNYHTISVEVDGKLGKFKLDTNVFPKAVPAQAVLGTGTTSKTIVYTCLQVGPITD